MNDLFKKPITIIIFVVAIAIVVIWSFVEKRSAEKAEEEAAKTAETAAIEITNLANADPTDFDEVVKDEYSLANSKALEADAGNVFSGLVVELPGDIKVASGNNRYVFSSTSNPNNNWIITISQKSGSYLRSTIPKEDYLGNLTAVDSKLWKFNYVTALQIAEKSGGKEWREANTTESVTLTLINNETYNRLIWTVEYSGETDKKVINVDANSGKVLE